MSASLSGANSSFNANRDVPLGQTSRVSDLPPSSSISFPLKAAEEGAFHDEVIDAHASNIIFFDVEAVHTTNISDTKGTHIVQFGAVDGLGRTFSVDIRPAVQWAQVNDDGGFFSAHNFQRFFTPSALAANSDFTHTWPRIREWIFRGPGRSNRPVVLVGHNIFAYDVPVLKKELGPLHYDLFNPDVVLFDTLRVLREWRRPSRPGELKLEVLHQRYVGSPSPHAHCALADAQAVRRLVQVDADHVLRPQLRRRLLKVTPLSSASSAEMPREQLESVAAVLLSSFHPNQAQALPAPSAASENHNSSSRPASSLTRWLALQTHSANHPDAGSGSPTATPAPVVEDVPPVAGSAIAGPHAALPTNAHLPSTQREAIREAELLPTSSTVLFAGSLSRKHSPHVLPAASSQLYNGSPRASAVWEPGDSTSSKSSGVGALKKPVSVMESKGARVWAMWEVNMRSAGDAALEPVSEALGLQAASVLKHLVAHAIKNGLEDTLLRGCGISDTMIVEFKEVYEVAGRDLRR